MNLQSALPVRAEATQAGKNTGQNGEDHQHHSCPAICIRPKQFISQIDVEDTRKFVSFCLKHEIVDHRFFLVDSSLRSVGSKILTDFSGLCRRDEFVEPYLRQALGVTSNGLAHGKVSPMPAPENDKAVPLGYLATVVSTIGSCTYFASVFVITKYSYRLNGAFGLFCSLVLAFAGLSVIAFGYVFIRESQPVSNQTDRRFLIPFLENFTKYSFTQKALEIRKFEISFFIPVVTLFLSSWASLAYGLAKLTPAAYAHPDQSTFWLMFQHYLWQIVDMVPLVEAWKHVHIDDPILENRLWPGILVIAFRLIILYVVLSAGAKLFGFDKRDKARN